MIKKNNIFYIQSLTKGVVTIDLLSIRIERLFIWIFICF